MTRGDLFFAAALFVVAVGARGPLIVRGETLLHSDEAIVGLMAQDIAAGSRYPVYFYGQRYMGALEAYVVAALSPLFNDPIVALRLAPALFFAAMCAMQFLMITRWFGRRPALIGAVVLIAAPPMFAQWTISARGGYVEVLAWGAALLWCYSEWFAAPARSANRAKRFLFGLILGSGFWINPSIMLFALPIALHWIVSLRRPDEPRPLSRRREIAEEPRPSGRRRGVAEEPRPSGRANPLLPAGRFSRTLPGPLGLLKLPVVALMIVIVINAVWYVHVDHGRVRSELLLGLLPRQIAVAMIAVAFLVGVTWAARRTRLVNTLRGWTTPALLASIAGALTGALPALWYVAHAALASRALEPSLPLGFRPLWTVSETASYLWHGLPLLLGADPRPFLHLVTIGRPSPLEPVDVLAHGFLVGANWLVLGAMITGAIAFLHAHRRQLSAILRMTPHTGCPVTLLLMGMGIGVMLYLFSGAAHDFNTIRYLIPLWAFAPGIIAAAVAQMSHRSAARLAVIAACLAWSVGQFEMYRMIGRPHPLRPLANAMVEQRIDPAVADIFDAQLLSYLTGQRCRVAEFNPFWSRLEQYQPLVAAGPVSYVVSSRKPARRKSAPGEEWRYPGPPPPETAHPLRREIDMALAHESGLLADREPLPCGYEHIQLHRPLAPRQALLERPAEDHPSNAE